MLPDYMLTKQDQEHDFSILVDSFFSEIRKSRANSVPLLTSRAPTISLACAEGNLHVFGPRLIKEYLLKEGILARCLYPSFPFDDIIAAAKDTSAKIVGISVSTEEQAENVKERWRRYVQTPEYNNSLVLLLGGLGVSSIKALSPRPHRAYVHTGDLLALKSLIETIVVKQAA